MKKPKHLTYEKYQSANSSAMREKLVAEIFEYATKLDENFNDLSKHLGKRLAGVNMELAILDAGNTDEPVAGAYNYKDGFKRGSLKGRQEEINELFRTPFLMVTTNFTSNLCPCCNGTGKVEGPEFDDVEACLTCNGTGVLSEDAGYVHTLGGSLKANEADIFKPGEIEAYAHTMTGFAKAMETQDTCPHCNGAGCASCGGIGTVEECDPVKYWRPEKSTTGEKILTARDASVMDIDNLKDNLNLLAPGVCISYNMGRKKYTQSEKSFELNLNADILNGSQEAKKALKEALVLFTNLDAINYV